MKPWSRFVNRRRDRRALRAVAERTPVSRPVNWAGLEPLEPRLLLTTAPTLATLPDVDLSSGSPLHISLDGFDAEGQDLTFAVSSDNANIAASVLTGNRSMRIDVADFGSMTFQLFEQRAGRVTSQIITLAQSDFYDGVSFHRIVNGFVIQGGDPTGTGGGGSTLGDFDDQFDPTLQHNRTGLLSMAKTNDDTNDSQFFITEVDNAELANSDLNLRNLDFNHSIFGVLTEGEAVRQAISNVAVDGNNRPNTPVIMDNVEIFNDTENGVLMLSAPEGFTGSADVTVTVTDTDGNETQQVFTVSATPDTLDAQPYLGEIEPMRTRIDTELQFQLPFTDIDGGEAAFFRDQETMQLIGVPVPANVDDNVFLTVNNSGLATFSAPNNFTGTVRNAVAVAADGQFGGFKSDVQVVEVTVFDFPQLQGTSFSVSPGDISDTGEVVIDFEITNLGGLPFSDFDVSFYISEDGSIEGSDVLLGTVNITEADIASGIFTGQATFDLPVANAPIFTNPGDTRTIGMIIDQAGDVDDESDTGDNSNRGGGLDSDTIDLNPVANDDVFTILASDALVMIDVFANDTDISGFTSIDPFSLQIFTDPSRGTASFNSGTGELTYIPTNPDFDDAGIDTFRYTVRDVTGRLSNIGTVTIRELENLRGTAFDAAVDNVAPSESFTIDFTVENGGAAPEADFDVQFYISADATIEGSDVLLGTRTITVAEMANGSFAGQVTLNMPASTDAFLAGTQTMFTLGMIVDSGEAIDELDETDNVNRGAGLDLETFELQFPPVAVDDDFIIDETQTDVPLTIYDNDTDRNGDGTIDPPSVVFLAGGPANGSIDLDLDTGEVLYTPGAGFAAAGGDTFTYQVQDAAGRVSNIATITITLPTPTANDDDVARTSIGFFDIDVLDNDVPSADDFDLPTLTIVDAPTRGEVTIDDTTGLITYTPTSAFYTAGTDTFTYTVDNTLMRTSNEATVTVTYDPGTSLGIFGGRDRLMITQGETDVTFNLAGDGEGEVFDNNGEINVIIQGTSARSTLNILARGGDNRFDVNDIAVLGPANRINGRTTDVGGNIFVDGRASMNLGDIAENHQITIGGPTNDRDAIILQFERMQDVTLTSETPIRLLQVIDWIDTDAAQNPDSITAPWIASLISRGDRRNDVDGDFMAGLTLTGEGDPRQTLNVARISGDLGGTETVEWNITGDAGVIFAQDITNLDLTLMSDLRSLRARQVTDSSFNIDGDAGVMTASAYDNTTINAHSMRVLNALGDRRADIAGDFTGSLTLTGEGDPRQTLASARFLGDIGEDGGGTTVFDLTGDVGVLFAQDIFNLDLDVNSSLRSLRARQIVDSDIDVDGDAGVMTAAAYENTTINAHSMRVLNALGDRRADIEGNFTGALTLTGEGDPRQTLASARFLGDIGEDGGDTTVFDLTGDVGAITAVDIFNLDLDVNSSLRSLRARQIVDSNIDVDGDAGVMTAAAYDNTTINAHSMRVLNALGDRRADIEGNFTGALTLTGEGDPRQTLASARFLGNIGEEGQGTLDWNLTGDVGAIQAVDIFGLNLDINSSLRSTRAKRIVDSVIDIDGNGGVFNVASITGSTLSADTLTTLIANGDRRENIVGDLLLDLTLRGNDDPRSSTVVRQIRGTGQAGGIWILEGDTGPIQAASFSGAFVNIAGDVPSIRATEGDLNGLFAAQNIGRVDIARDLVNGVILAGTDLGDDAGVGGTGTAADTFGPGTLGPVKIGRHLLEFSLIGAGLDVADLFAQTADVPTIVGGPESTIQSVSAGGQMDVTVIIAAGDLPDRIGLFGGQFAIAEDAQIITGDFTPDTLNGVPGIVQIDDGIDPFGAFGAFLLEIAPNGTTYTITALGGDTEDSTGDVLSNVSSGPNLIRLDIDDSVLGVITVELQFRAPNAAIYTALVNTTVGQTGTIFFDAS